MEPKEIICKKWGDPTLAVGDYMMVKGEPRRIIYLMYQDGRAITAMMEPVICPREQLEREQAEACHAAIMEYITGVREGSIIPYEAAEAYLFEHLPGKYLGNGRFKGVDDKEA